MDKVTMSKKECNRLGILQRTIDQQITQKEASNLLRLSLRQTKRLCKRLKLKGPIGLVHKNRGKLSSRKIPTETGEKILGLSSGKYEGFGPQLLSEHLNTDENIQVSREWLRLFLAKNQLWQVKGVKHKRSFQRRNRRPREGELVQIDGSYHPKNGCWFKLILEKS